MTTLTSNAIGTDGNAVITLHNVGRRFRVGGLHPAGESRDETGLWAVREISFTANKGEIIGVIGRNGSGKSTLLNILAGTLPVTEGKLNVSGSRACLLALGAGFQDEFTGRENIALNGRLIGYTPDELEARFDGILDFSELGDFIDSPLGSYSAGMKMRLGFSIAVHKPFEILITDEILSVGDVNFQKKCFELMAGLKRRGKTIILATQDIEFAQRFCDRLLLLEDGKLRFFGDPRQAVELYLKFLNTRRELSLPSRLGLNTATKRWATDMSEWGKREGTKEIELTEVLARDRWGRQTGSVRCGQELTVTARFTVHDRVDDTHFGVAVFREDGVYCYGPNTGFDGVRVPSLMPGMKGSFSLRFNRFNLRPGAYRFSIAAWDKRERLAYDYHKCSHEIRVAGEESGELCALDGRWHGRVFPLPSPYRLFVPELLAGKWETASEEPGARITVCDAAARAQKTFQTGHEMRLHLEYRCALSPAILWIGIYRSDGIYCCGFERPARGVSGRYALLFRNLPLLPGEYRVSAALIEAHARAIVSFTHGISVFNVVSAKNDHGTLYMPHEWNIAITRHT